MELSKETKELFEALAKAQGEIDNVERNATSHHGKYATLAACWDVLRSPFTKNGLSITQFPEYAENGVCIVTQINHSSGQWMRGGKFAMPVDRTNAQAMGSAISYARRYSLCAVTGIAPDDDDGGGKAQDNPPRNGVKPQPAKPKCLPPVKPFTIMPEGDNTSNEEITAAGRKLYGFLSKSLADDVDAWLDLNAELLTLLKAVDDKAETAVREIAAKRKGA